MRINRFSLPRLVGTVGLAFALAGVGAVAAADNQPTAFLYEGTCANLDTATVYDEIDDLENDDLRRIWALIGNGQTQPEGLIGEEDDIDRLTDVQVLVDGDYAVVVHETQRTSTPVLVCGDVEGQVQNGTLLIELAEVDGSGQEGRTFIQPDDDDDDIELEFVVGMYPAGSVEPLTLATPAS